MRRRFLRILKWLFLLLLLLAGWCGWLAWRIYSFSEEDQARQADVAVVLGAAAWHLKPSPVLEERINHAIELYQSGTVRKILFTGGFGDNAPRSESEVSRDYAIQHGVKDADILIEKVSRSTSENVEQALDLMSRHQLKTALLVSDPLHMRRAVSMMQDRGATVYSSPTPTSRYVSENTRTAFLWREVYYYTVYLITGH